MPASAFKVAYAIATSLKRNSGTKTLVSSDTGNTDIRELWIGCKDLADKIAMSHATVLEMGKRLERNGHLLIAQGRQGSGHSHHYRLVDKCQPANISKCQPTNISETDKCHPANISERKNVSQPIFKCQPANMNPFVPSEEIPIEERESAQLDPGKEAGRRSPSLSLDIEALFEKFYARYPKKKFKAKALQAYRAALKKGATPEALVAGAMRVAADFEREAARRGRDTAYQYVPHPANWLKGGGWEDEPPIPAGNSMPPASDHIAISELIARQLMEKDGGGHVH